MRIWIAACLTVACSSNHGSVAIDAAGGDDDAATGDATPVDAGPPSSLTVMMSGIGVGTVTADTGPIACRAAGGTCIADYPASASVTLTAVPDAGYVFAGWKGEGCKGVATCTVAMVQARTVRATFIELVFKSRRALDGTNAPNPNSTYNLWRSRTNGTGLVALTHITAAVASAAGPQWSPDGEHIVFQSQAKADGSNGSAGSFAIWSVDADGTNLRALTSGVAVFPRWSPDGTRISYDFTENGADSVWVMNADGTNQHQLFKGITGTWLSSAAAWSPDGMKLTFASNLALDGTSTSPHLDHDNIWVIDADGTNLVAVTKLTASGAYSDGPDWSPDGTRIVYSSQRAIDGSDAKGTTSNLWIVGPTGQSGFKITSFNSAIATLAQWSPDGTTIAFFGSGSLGGQDAPNLNNGVYNIWTVHPDGTSRKAVTQLTAANVSSGSLAWSADSREFAYFSTRAADGSDTAGTIGGIIWLLAKDGTNLRSVAALTATGADAGSPAWAIR